MVKSSHEAYKFGLRDELQKIAKERLPYIKDVEKRQNFAQSLAHAAEFGAAGIPAAYGLLRRVLGQSPGAGDVHIFPQKVSDPVAKKLMATMGLKGKVDLGANTWQALKGGGGVYYDDAVEVLAKNPKRLSGFERGILSHELGHAKTWTNPRMKPFMAPYMGARLFATLVPSTLGVAAATQIEDRKKALAATAAASLPSAAIFGEEALATARGLKGLAKMQGGGVKGWGKALLGGKAGALRSALYSGLSYGSLLAAPTVAYILKQKLDERAERRAERSRKRAEAQKRKLKEQEG